MIHEKFDTGIKSYLPKYKISTSLSHCLKNWLGETLLSHIKYNMFCRGMSLKTESYNEENILHSNNVVTEPVEPGLLIANCCQLDLVHNIYLPQKPIYIMLEDKKGNVI
jgi:hypothetical protein